MDIFLDIETIPSECPPDPAQVTPPKSLKNLELIEAYRQEKATELWKAEALESAKGRLLCFGFAFDDAEPDVLTVGLDAACEADVLLNFHQRLMDRLPHPGESLNWIGFNLRRFDLLWLRRLAIKHAHAWNLDNLRSLACLLPWQRWDVRVCDLYEWWSGADHRVKGGLNDVARFFGLPGKADGMDGSRVFELWRDGRLQDVADYCRQDVATVRDVYRIMAPCCRYMPRPQTDHSNPGRAGGGPREVAA